MAEAREIQVHMCQLAVGSGADVLRATLGSCVGIGLLWRERALYGLAHCLLPGDRHARIAEGLGGVGAKYVTQAVPSLLRLMGITEQASASIEAVLAGGANMVCYPGAPRHGAIGEQNVRLAQQLLGQHGLRIVHSDVGGECGRQLTINCAQHEYRVRKFARSP
jgi:chemotaxis protein CheD